MSSMFGFAGARSTGDRLRALLSDVSAARHTASTHRSLQRSFSAPPDTTVRQQPQQQQPPQGNAVGNDATSLLPDARTSWWKDPAAVRKVLRMAQAYSQRRQKKAVTLEAVRAALRTQSNALCEETLFLRVLHRRANRWKRDGPRDPENVHEVKTRLCKLRFAHQKLLRMHAYTASQIAKAEPTHNRTELSFLTIANSVMRNDNPQRAT